MVFSLAAEASLHCFSCELMGLLALRNEGDRTQKEDITPAQTPYLPTWSVQLTKHPLSPITLPNDLTSLAEMRQGLAHTCISRPSHYKFRDNRNSLSSF